MTTPTAQSLGVQAESEQAEQDRRAVLQEAAGRTHSPSDQLAYRMDLLLIEHPEWCSTDADYPDWTPAHLAPGYPQAEQCWCGHPESRHWTSEQMTLGAGCHDCAGWNGAHRFGRELPWTSEAGEPA
jgi:hypothetical protein